MTLPFFDDFSELSVVPNQSLWVDSSVFINADFPINPPSLGVATFDGLDSYGNAYGKVDANIFGQADTLTSHPINLSPFNPGDSIYLSFYYQAQGRSFEPLASSDSLVLQFKNKFNAWVTVWVSPGIAQEDFKIAMLPVSDTSYLHPSFQFRWVNYQLYIGNLKQWHIDYVYMNQGRNINDRFFQDQAIVYLPKSPFQPYTQVPWNHLKQNPASYLRSSFPISVSNLSTTGETFTISMSANDPTDNIGSASLGGQSLAANGISEFTLSPNLNIFSNPFDSSYVRVVSRLSDILGGNDVRQNDSAERIVELANYYAYDDGTAETGYGIRNSSGSVAYGFQMEQADSIRGIWIHFTQAEAPVTFGLALNLWQVIAPPYTPSSSIDQLIYSKQVGLPVYTDSINGFHLYLFDSAIYVDKHFYIGWTQISSFLANVGMDLNYTYNDSFMPNPNAFYNVHGEWVPSGVSGTMMMRPVVGKMWPLDPLSIKSAVKKEFRVYPNPAHKSFHLDGLDEEISQIDLYDMSGRIQRSYFISESYSLEGLVPGIYLLRIRTTNGAQLSKKLMIE
ncbi:MAG: T9SS type A sorting domain-containing protein [Bacteroidetes bacterium]|nr:T9SS type A sorting domain-containing protein [Bacteroidota bacterium]